MGRVKPSAHHMAAILAAYGIPAPVVEYRFYPGRRWAFDYAWPAKRVALELEGGAWTGGRHVRGKGYEGDCQKYNAAIEQGWRVWRLTWDMFDRGEFLEAIAAMVRGDL